jgi:hypothetical protein
MVAIITSKNGKLRAEETGGSSEPELGSEEWVSDVAADLSEARRKLSEARGLTHPDSL